MKAFSRRVFLRIHLKKQRATPFARGTIFLRKDIFFDWFPTVIIRIWKYDELIMMIGIALAYL
jgi:hypothetical protein